MGLKSLPKPKQEGVLAKGGSVCKGNQLRLTLEAQGRMRMISSSSHNPAPSRWCWERTRKGKTKTSLPVLAASTSFAGSDTLSWTNTSLTQPKRNANAQRIEATPEWNVKAHSTMVHTSTRRSINMTRLGSHLRWRRRWISGGF